ncbi:MAG: DUF2804 domain-containing protein [Niameybacter sp.]
MGVKEGEWMQREIGTRGKLLNEQGKLNEVGYATSLVLEYSREDIQASKWRIKEWDYYLMMNKSYGAALTIADNGYMGLVSVSILDFKNRRYHTKSHMVPFTFGKLALPKSSKKGDIRYVDEHVELYIFNGKEGRRLRCYMKNFNQEKPFECEFLLTNPPKDSMVIATPFKGKSNAFYYNQKIVGMSAHGYAKTDKLFCTFRQSEAQALLDWGRGVWPYDSTWYWGAAMGKVNDKNFGFNIGYGFGDTSAASENMLFYEGIAHKLEEVRFHIPELEGKVNYLAPWKFTSSDGRFEMIFKPILDRKDHAGGGFIVSDQHQVFGKYSGKVLLDDGTLINIEEVLGFAEKVHNKW